MKIAIIGDIHIRERNFPVRKDDYLSSILDKLEYVLDRYEKVICLGDMFEDYKNSDYIFYRVSTLLNKYPKKFITIFGNHDINGRNHSDLSKCTIGNLDSTGMLEIKKEPFEIDGVKFVVSLVDKSNFSSIEVDEENENVLLGHNYYNLDSENASYEESMSKNDIRRLNYKQVFLGHDHKPYDEDYVGSSHLIRMGSFSRKDRQSYNENREINYYEYDTKTREVEKRTVPSLPDEEVFIDNAFEKKLIKSEINFVKIGEVLARFKKTGEGNISLAKTLEKMGCPLKYIQQIKRMHEISNVDFN